MNMIEAVTSCFRQYVGFAGRARRSEFWYWTLFTVLAGIVLSVFDGFIVGFENSDNGPLGNIFSLATLLPGLAVSWRRLHDTGRSGWWVGGFYLTLIFFGLIIGAMYFSGIEGYMTPGGILAVLLGIGLLVYAVTLIVFFCLDSEPGHNQYGENPKNEGNFAVFD